MSTLRKSLKRPETYLGISALTVILIFADTFRSPESQITGWLYVRGVYVYQAVGRPLLEGHIKCRYQPTCSDYSIQAVERFGIRKGLALTYQRLNSCRTSVPLGTIDPIPENIEVQ